MAGLDLDTLPLFELFERLRDIGFALGVDDYLALRKALIGGYGMESKMALERLCGLLWAKSPADIQRLRLVFKQVMGTIEIPDDRLMEREPVSTPMEKKSSMSQTEPEPSQPTPQPEQQPTPSVKISSFPTRSSVVLPEIERRYDFSEYLPLSRREMKQGWRFLRRRVYDGPPVLLDVPETVDRSCRQGFYLYPVLHPQPRSDARLMLLLDYGGSMIPFHRLINNLVTTAQGSGVFEPKNLEVYYFRNSPIEFLYTDPALVFAKPINEVLANASRRTSLLIASDAGAARRNYDLDRVETTTDLIITLKQKIPYLAWLNPLPQERWPGTPAKLISKLIPMYPMDYTGFYRAINHLRGQP